MPNHGWLDSSGLLLDDGVVCDEFCRAVGQPGVHAVGDVARWRHPRHAERVRVEHWTSAVEQASCVAHNIGHPARCAPARRSSTCGATSTTGRSSSPGRPGGAPHAVVGDPDDGWFAALYAAGTERSTAPSAAW